MGGCNSGGNKDKEVDLFCQKHLKRNPIQTSQDNYEISGQILTKEQMVLTSKRLGDEMEIEDEHSEIQKERQSDLEMVAIAAQLTNEATYVRFQIMGPSQGYDVSNTRVQDNPYRPPATQWVVETSELFLPGEEGTGGKPMPKQNPYLEINMVDPEDEIIFQGELFKYKPGFTGNFVERWIQVTPKAFRYYAGRPGTAVALLKPLMAIPISAIKSIDRIDYDLKLKKTDVKGHDMLTHAFEIFLKEDFLDIFLRPDYERLVLPDTKRNDQSLRKVRNRHRDEIKNMYILEEENRALEPLGQAAMQSLNTHDGAWSNRVGRWPLSNKRLIFSTKKEELTEEWLQLFANNLVIGDEQIEEEGHGSKDDDDV